MHALQELSDAAAVLAEGSLVGPLDRQRRLRWAERLQVTQSSLPTQVSTCPLAFQCEAGASYRPRVCSASEQHKALCSLYLPLTSAHCEAAFTSAARRQSYPLTTLPSIPGYAGTQLLTVRYSHHHYAPSIALTCASDCTDTHLRLH